MIDLTGTTALVTGGSRGVGRATALMLADCGADVGIVYRNRRADAEAVVRAVRDKGCRSFAGAADLSDPSAVEKVFREFKAGFGHLDCLVANAGVWPEEDTPLASVSAERWRTTMASNLDSMYYTLKGAIPLMRRGGAIVLVSSTAGQRGEAGHADYAASKGAIISLTKSLAVECAPDIRVNCVAPGWVDTEMSADPLGGKEANRIRDGIPLRRVADAEDIAGPIVFLCSDMASQITGEILNVNGGSVLCG
jgi:3-oxoacyl-[acyl-carrier protein] reductase